MNLEQEELRLLDKGWKPAEAHESARVSVSFAEAEEKGLVRFQVLPDEEMYDDSYIDTWTNEPEEFRVQAKLDLWRRIEREGVWGIVVEKHFHCDACGTDRWDHVDSCWSYVGDDWRDSGTDTDAKRAALDAIGWEY